MFSSGSKTNQRYNGNLASTLDRTVRTKPSNSLNHNRTTNKIQRRNVKNHHVDKHIKHAVMENGSRTQFNIKTEVKEEIVDEDLDRNLTAHSIIGLNYDNALTSAKTKINKATHHEMLQRIDNESGYDDGHNHYQKNWFSASLERMNLEKRSREERIEITRHECRRQLHQIMRSNLGHSNKLSDLSNSRKSSVKDLRLHRNGYDRLVAPRVCEIENCFQPALPCTKYCTLHIMYNPEQVLFSSCTAKFADNTQCSVPVFDITHELPLCPEHARKRDNYKLYQEAKPKKLRKKVKPSAMIRPQKRNKKKKKVAKPLEVITPSAILESPMKEIEVQETIETESPELVEDMHIVDQVLGFNEADGLEHDLTAQASHILEETDISTVLSTIHVDEFNDFFAGVADFDFESFFDEDSLLSSDNSTI
ncbi:INO80 complex subunit D isoform X2 [Coccinella septempunctata]|uniref:INO80 complex subunit D isoform X2 n=1 Tax=Coccinella septempunctata TaxID=41139 RepID=UPI001D065ECA|nr:INO80 complex subunit D isoform X2 [Coccinella septempunctata]